jgi:endonuclease/exonuclease/phosphatase family metal-dependent hydrolase
MLWVLPVLQGLSWLTSDALPVVALLSHVPHLLLPLAGPLACVALLGRRPVLGGVLLLLFVAGVRPWLAPASPSPAEGHTGDHYPLVLCTWNLGNGRTPPPKLRQFLQESEADVVALQEVNQAYSQALQRSTDRYPHQAVYPEGIPGLALLSRWPIQQHRHIPESGRLPWLEVVLEIEGTALRVWNIHVSGWVAVLGQAAYDRSCLNLLREDIRGPLPFVALGDFNMSPGTTRYQEVVASGLLDAFEMAGKGFGFTFPVPRRWRGVPLPPCLRIDYCWISLHWRPLTAEVLADAGSDHFPVQVALIRKNL